MPRVYPSPSPGGCRIPFLDVVDVSEDRFEELVIAALDELPDQLADALDNVMVRIMPGRRNSQLLGEYVGIPLTEREDYGGWGEAPLPDQITIFRGPICAMCTTDDEVVEQVRITVLHELAHHFGIDDDRLHELGWA